MAGNLEINSNLDIYGSLKLSSVPNQIGTVLTYNDTTRQIGFRTNSELLNDLGLYNYALRDGSNMSGITWNGFTAQYATYWNEYDGTQLASSIIYSMVYDDTVNKWRPTNANGLRTFLGITNSVLNPTLQNVVDNGNTSNKPLIVGDTSYSSGSIFKDTDFTFLTTQGEALRILIGGLLVSNNYNDASLVPTNGIYSKGDINTNANLNAVRVASRSSFVLENDDSLYKSIAWQTNGNLRWYLTTDPHQETGGNSGSPLSLYRYADDGSYLGQVLTMNRSNGLITFRDNITTDTHYGSAQWALAYERSNNWNPNPTWDNVLANSSNYATNLTPMLYGANPYKLILRSRGLIGDNYFSFQDVNGAETAYQGFGSGSNEDYTFLLRNNGGNRFQWHIGDWIMDMTNNEINHYKVTNMYRDLFMLNGVWIYANNSNSNEWTQAYNWGDHREYSGHGNQQYLGGNYVSGGQEKPNYFGGGKLKLQMLEAGSNIGASGWGWSDVLWMSSYSGGDVKMSTAIISDKYSNKIGFAKQDFDSATWGTVYEFLTKANFANGTTAQYIRGDGSLDTLPVYTAGNGLTLSGNTFSLPISQTGSGNAVTSVVQNTNGITVTKTNFALASDLNSYANIDGGNTIGGSWMIDNIYSNVLGSYVGEKELMRTNETNGYITFGNPSVSRIKFMTRFSMVGLSHFSNEAGFEERIFTGHNLKFSTGLSYNPANGLLTVTGGGTYLAGNGLTLSGNTFSLPVSTSGSGTFVSSVTQNANGITVSYATPPNTTYSAGNGLTLSGTQFSLPISISGSGNSVTGVSQNANGLTIGYANRVSSISMNVYNVYGMRVNGSDNATITTSGTFELSTVDGYRMISGEEATMIERFTRQSKSQNYVSSSTSFLSLNNNVGVHRIYRSLAGCQPMNLYITPKEGDRITIHGEQFGGLSIKANGLSAYQNIYTWESSTPVTTYYIVMLCATNARTVCTLVYRASLSAWVVEAQEI